MSNLNFLHSGGNKVTLSAPTSDPSSNPNFKLPQSDGSAGQVLQTDGNGNLSFVNPSTNTPAFHAWSNNVTSHSIADATFTKVTFLNSETLDTDNAYDNATSGTTANRFTVPSGKGGFYQVNAGLNF